MSISETQSAFENIRLDRRGHVLHIELSRPERLNALSRATLLELNRAMDEAEGDANIRAIVISGAGRAFSSGFDLKDQAQEQPSGAEVWRRRLALSFNTTMRFWRCPKPTVAAVHGACLAGAFELALACDITIAAEGAIFGEPELKFGAGIVTMLLPWVTGPKQAKHTILCGLDNISAAEALRLGFVSQVVPAGTHVEAALRIAADIAAIDPELVMETKKAINRCYEIQGIETALKAAVDTDLLIESHGSPDKKEFMTMARQHGLKAALAWRDSRFNSE
jgi:enoyl-CoA hydratase/carnithine racemase